MRTLLAYAAFVAVIVSLPFITDWLLEQQLPQEGFTAEEVSAHSELVVRAGLEADARSKKPSLSEQALIVRDLYGY